MDRTQAIEAVAREFARRVREYAGDERILGIFNDGGGLGDLCDDNQFALDAFKAVFGREAEAGTEGDTLAPDLEFVGEAMDLANRRGLWIQVEGDEDSLEVEMEGAPDPRPKLTDGTLVEVTVLESGERNIMSWGTWLADSGKGLVPETVEEIRTNLERYGSHRQCDANVPEEAFRLRVLR